MNTRKLFWGTTLALGLATALEMRPGVAQVGLSPRDNAPTAQERQLFAAERAQRLSATLERNGVTGTDVLAIIAFATAQDSARQAVRDRVEALSLALRASATTDAQIAALLSQLRAATTQEQTRRNSALNALNGQLRFGQKPRLEALLTTLGLIGDPSLLGGAGRGFGGPRGRGFGGERDGRRPNRDGLAQRGSRGRGGFGNGRSFGGRGGFGGANAFGVDAGDSKPGDPMRDGFGAGAGDFDGPPLF